MGNNAVKTIVFLMVLVVLSFLIGAQVSDSLKESAGAFALIAVIVVGFLLLLFGKKSWYLIFLLPPVLANVPARALNSATSTYAVAAGLFLYQIIQSKVMGYTRMRWHSAFFFDVWMVILLVYMSCSYIRYPVSVQLLGLDMEYVGGSVYVCTVGSLIYYLFISTLDVKRADLERVLKWAFNVQLLMLLVSIAIQVKTGQIYWGGGVAEEDASFTESAGEERITLLAPLGFFILTFVYASRPFWSLLRSPLHLGACAAALAGISLSGSRGMLVQAVLIIFAVSTLRRELVTLLMMGVLIWVGMLGLGNGGAFLHLPYTAQRFIAIVPGVKVSEDVEQGTRGSSEIRLYAWKRAFDPHAGHIHDYIWGDGFQTSVKKLERLNVASMRGSFSEQAESRETWLANAGLWHNGFITTMHRLGLAGCFVFYVVMLLGLFLFIKVGRCYVMAPFFPFFCVHCAKTFYLPFSYSYNAMTPESLFAYMPCFALLKLLYCLLREDGQLLPLFHLRQRYVPLLIREMEHSAAPH